MLSEVAAGSLLPSSVRRFVSALTPLMLFGYCSFHRFGSLYLLSEVVRFRRTILPRLQVMRPRVSLPGHDIDIPSTGLRKPRDERLNSNKPPTGEWLGACAHGLGGGHREFGPGKPYSIPPTGRPNIVWRNRQEGDHRSVRVLVRLPHVG